jgi:hypothetical protein
MYLAAGAAHQPISIDQLKLDIQGFIEDVRVQIRNNLIRHKKSQLNNGEILNLFQEKVNVLLTLGYNTGHIKWGFHYVLHYLTKDAVKPLLVIAFRKIFGENLLTNDLIFSAFEHIMKQYLVSRHQLVNDLNAYLVDLVNVLQRENGFSEHQIDAVLLNCYKTHEVEHKLILYYTFGPSRPEFLRALPAYDERNLISSLVLAIRDEIINDHESVISTLGGFARILCFIASKYPEQNHVLSALFAIALHQIRTSSVLPIVAIMLENGLGLASLFKEEMLSASILRELQQGLENDRTRDYAICDINQRMFALRSSTRYSTAEKDAMISRIYAGTPTNLRAVFDESVKVLKAVDHVRSIIKTIELNTASQLLETLTECLDIADPKQLFQCKELAGTYKREFPAVRAFTEINGYLETFFNSNPSMMRMVLAE